MKLSNTLAACAIAALLIGLAPYARAGDGHDHGDAPPPAAGPALPRFSAVSELFELVGVVDGRELRLYLDHFADNSPVKDASLELEFDGVAVPVQAHADGEFEATLQAALKPGVVSVTATVISGDAADLLAGELDVHEDAHEHEEAQGQMTSWKSYAPWLGAGIVVLGLAGWGALRKGQARTSSSGGVA